MSIREEGSGEAMLSERAGHIAGHDSDSDSDERRVQFNRARFHIEPTGENIVEEVELIAGDDDDKDKKNPKG